MQKVQRFGSTPNQTGGFTQAADPWTIAQHGIHRVHDGHIRCAVYFRGQLDKDRLACAIGQSLQAVPLLRCRFVPDEKQPFWQEAPADTAKLLTVVSTNCTDDEVQLFLRGKSGAEQGQQIRFRLVRGQARDTLCVVISRMVCDSAGLKEYLYLLGRIYTEIQSPGFHPPRPPQAGLAGLWRRLPPMARFHLRHGRPAAVPPQSQTQPVPLSGKEEVSFLVTATLPVSRCRAIAKYAAVRHARFSDVLLAAYIRGLHAMSGQSKRGLYTVLNENDMRRFLPWGEDHALGALSLPQMLTLTSLPGESFWQTLQHVKAVLFPFQTLAGAVSHAESLGLFSIAPAGRTKTGTKADAVALPPLLFGDFGRVDAARLQFERVEVNDVMFCGPIFHQPRMGLYASVFEDSLTFSCGLYGTRTDWATCKYFLAMMLRELPHED